MTSSSTKRSTIWQTVCWSDWLNKHGWLTTGLLLQQLPLAVDDAEDEQSQQHSGKSDADDCSQGHVPGAGHHRGQRHQVDTPTTCGRDARKIQNSFHLQGLPTFYSKVRSLWKMDLKQKICDTIMHLIPFLLSNISFIYLFKYNPTLISTVL